MSQNIHSLKGSMSPRHMRSIRNRRVFRKNLALFTLALPALLHVLIFSYLPMPGIVIAFKDYKPFKGIFGSAWNGLNNFEFFFTSQDAGRTIRNTVLYSIDFLILDLVLGVIVALMLYSLRSKAMVKLYHTIMMLPKFLSIIIVSYIVYTLLSPSYGVMNQLIRAFGGDKVQWYMQTTSWPVILTLTHAWMFLGGGCLFYYAALVAIDESLFEAAKLDGANKWHEIRYVCLPHLVPIMCITTILGIGGLFSGDMGLFYSVPKDQGILYPTTDIINTYVYRALASGNLARSTAVNLFQSVVGLVLVVVTNGIVRKVSPENSMF